VFCFFWKNLNFILILTQIIFLVNSDVCPSFVLMDIQGGHAIVYTYQLRNGEVKVEKLEHKMKV
jgi:hypothetical protein